MFYSCFADIPIAVRQRAFDLYVAARREHLDDFRPFLAGKGVGKNYPQNGRYVQYKTSDESAAACCPFGMVNVVLSERQQKAMALGFDDPQSFFLPDCCEEALRLQHSGFDVSWQDIRNFMLDNDQGHFKTFAGLAAAMGVRYAD